jgi:[protein-PII] uridylyltransferase
MSGDLQAAIEATTGGDWIFLATARARLAAAGGAVAQVREIIAEGDALLRERFHAEQPIENLVHDRARLVDAILVHAWQLHAGPHCAELALIAVGGYGRGELNPHSDIDVMVLLPKSEATPWQQDLERLVTFLWDLGLEVGHSVRTIDDCQRESLADVGVVTTLMEARLLAGPEPLFTAMRRALAPDRIWSSRDFFEAKVNEQVQRHHRYHDTAYNLEPNVKQGPGGLRDIQTVGWVAKRHFGAETLDELVDHGFLTQRELMRLKAAQSFLWRVRFGLHMATGRREDRLLFDHQIKLAKLFGYEDATYTLAVEQFMQRYYRTVMDVSLLNEMLLQLFREAILDQGDNPAAPINPRFQERNDYLEVTSDDVFVRQPSALLELFSVLQQQPHLRGVRAQTMRLVGRHLWLIDEEFRQNPRHHRLFLEILKAPEGVTHELRRMNLYGVLGRYIPAFGRIVGRMQYDLFHAYTVDEHTLFVVSNMRRLALPRFDHELPKLSQIFQSLPRQEVAYLAALFHDIAKGRGGDHSELGSVDAEAFCLELGLSRYDARLVAWLVRNHLIFSVTAQKKDITDPSVITEFARRVGDQTHLDYLYVLTASDVRATNPKLWNSWKASLFDEFYERVKQALRRGLETPIDPEELISGAQAEARALLAADHVGEDQVERIWSTLTDAYFQRHSPVEIAWHTRLLLGRADGENAPIVGVMPAAGRSGPTAIATHTSAQRHSFAVTTAALDQMGLNIVDARLTPTNDGFALDTYLVLEDDGSTITDRDRLAAIERNLRRALAEPEVRPATVTRRMPRQARSFTTATHVECSVDGARRRTILELVAGDRPGLLSEIGKVFWNENIHLHGAKIVTVGERAEDVFYLSDENGRPLDDAARERLREALIRAVDRRDAAA